MLAYLTNTEQEEALNQLCLWL